MLLTTAMFAQNRAILLNETFNTSTVPTGWEVYGGGSSNWSIENSNKAGGEANELQFYYAPRYIGQSYMSMGVFDFTDISSVIVSFSHYYERYSTMATPTIGIATSSDNGATWNIGWSQSYGETGKYIINEVVTSSDMGKADVKVALFFDGDSDDINFWCFDNIMMYVQEENDVNLNKINVNKSLGIGETDITFSVSNLGLNTIETLEARYQIEGQETITETFQVDIETFEEEQITFDAPVYLYPGTYDLSIEITSINGTEDDDPSNNISVKEIVVGQGIAQRKPMIEHFSSSTCYPCVFTNNEMAELTAANPGKYTYTKYPMNGPGTGDPYYFNECGTRRSFYNVQYVPTLILDGKTIDVITQEKFDESYNNSTFVDIRGAFNVEGNTINITADFMSYVDLANVKAYITVNEKTTTGNVGNNGETEFHHILMKMLNNAQGNPMTLEAGEIQRLEFSFDMSSTNVEEMDDLEVAMWIQSTSNKEVYNSNFAYEYTSHAYPAENLTLNFNDDKTSVEITWSAPEAGNPTGYNVYIDGMLMAVNTTELSYSDNTIAYNDGNEHIVEVVALYENGKTSLGIIKSSNSVIDLSEDMAESFNIYPNPAKDYVRISGEDIEAISVYNYLGILIDRIEVRSDNVELNTSTYSSGVYFITTEGRNGSSTKKVVIL